MRKLVIGDVHGCLYTLRSLVEEGIQLSRDDELYMLGDYIDRGPDSKGVLDYLMELKAEGYKLKCLRGNHEQMMCNSLTDREEMQVWLYNGGQEALTSFDTDRVEDIPEKYFDFVKDLPYYFEVDNYILVHAGLNFGSSTAKESKQGKQSFLWKMHNPFNDKQAMLWIRWWYEEINKGWLRDRIVVHGHTPISQDDICQMFEKMDDDQVLDIDNGCFAKFEAGMGHLCAFDMSNQELYFQENID